MRLVAESQALARLNHPNVVTAYEVGRHAGATYLIMEHVDGGTVRTWLAAEPRTAEAIADVFAQAAHGLAAAHAAGLVHRDVKPDNILVGSDGRARVSDFGLAGDGLDAPGKLQGTLRYMAPETLHGAVADARADQWGLCASLWEALFGAPPFAGDTPDELRAAIERGLPDIPAAPARVRRVLAGGLRREPAARFASLDEIATILAARPRPRRRMIAVVVATAALAGGVSAAFAMRDPRPTCSGTLAGVWDESRRAAVVAQLGGDTAAGVAAMLDAYARRWSVQRVEVCHAERAEQPAPMTEMRAACLESRRHALAVLVDMLAQRAPDVGARAVRAVRALPALDDCSSEDALADRQPLPAEPAVRARIKGLEERYDVARTNAILGDPRAAMPELLAVADAAEALAYQPLAADALRIVGREQLGLRDPQAVVTLRRALVAAQAGATSSRIAENAIDLLNAARSFGADGTVRDELRAQARAAVARLQWRRDPSALGARSYLESVEGDEAVDRGDLVAAERLLRSSVEHAIAAFGARDPQTAPMRSKLGLVLARLGKHDEAATMWAASADVDGDSLTHIANTVAMPAQPSLAMARIDAAWRLHDVGRDDEALAFARRVRVEQQRLRPSAMYTVVADDLESEIALARGDLTTARTLNARARAALGPSPAATHSAGVDVVRAMIDEAAGDCAAAMPTYRDVARVTADQTSSQLANLGLARCLAAEGDLDGAHVLLARELEVGIHVPREVPRALLAQADIEWRRGNHAVAHGLARRASEEVQAMPALTATRDAIAAWLAAHVAP